LFFFHFWNFTVLIIVNVEHFKYYGHHFQRDRTENTNSSSSFVGEKLFKWRESCSPVEYTYVTNAFIGISYNSMALVPIYYSELITLWLLSLNFLTVIKHILRKLCVLLSPFWNIISMNVLILTSFVVWLSLGR
jgi:hypothetical protein